MRIAILSESSADEAALRIIVEGILGVPTTQASYYSLQSRGWPAVRTVLPPVIRSLHFRSDAEGLVVVADSNHTVVSAQDRSSRLYELQNICERVSGQLTPVQGRVPMKMAVGIASPALESWLLCKRHQELSEHNWEKGIVEKRDPYSKIELKRRLYGVDIPSLELEKQKMCEAAREIIGDLAYLEKQFPNGFGSLAKALRAWRSVGA